MGLYYESGRENEVLRMYVIAAGSTAAKVLTGKGLHILLAERHELPRRKSFAGVLSQKTIDLVQRYYGQGDIIDNFGNRDH